MKLISALCMLMPLAATAIPDYEQLFMLAIPDNNNEAQERILSTILNPQHDDRQDQFNMKSAKLRIAIEYGRPTALYEMTQRLFVSQTRFTDGRTPASIIAQMKSNRYKPLGNISTDTIEWMDRIITRAILVENYFIRQLECSKKKESNL